MKLTLVLTGLLIPGFIASSPGGLLLVANKGDQTLGLIDPVSGRQNAHVAEGGVTGHEVAVSPDGQLVQNSEVPNRSPANGILVAPDEFLRSLVALFLVTCVKNVQ